MNNTSIKDLILIKKIDISSTREQIQEDLITYFDNDDMTIDMDEVCQIVVNNFKKLENENK